VFFAYTALSIGIVVLIPVVEVLIGVGLLYVLFILTFVIVFSTFEAIFKLALYEYASTGKVPQGFTSELIEGAVKRM